MEAPTLNIESVAKKPSSNMPFFILRSILLTIVVVVIIYYGYKYIFGVDLLEELIDIFSMKKNLTNIVDPVKKKEVFHISNNVFDYNESNAVCNALNARLATYEEVENAYNNGAEWCSYGWSEGGLILFPTQKSTYDTLQQTDKHKNDCGRQGVNGGYISNKKAKFGVNCYGYKPSNLNFDPEVYNIKPETKEEKHIKSLANKYKDNIDSMKILPFNKTKWSR
jgi:hypothetical protein